MSALGWKSPKTVWIAAGGTAGHLLPALGVAETLVREGTERSGVGFVGSGRLLEQQLIEPYGFEIFSLDTRGIRRSLAFSNVGALARMLKGIAEVTVLALKGRPSIMLGFGGYFSFPALVAGWLLHVPIVVVETNAVPGLANKILSHLATKNFVASPDWNPPRSEVVGVPLRPEITLATESSSDARFRSEHAISQSAFLVCVFGGSLGALKINEAVQSMVEKMRSNSGREVAIYHVIGSRDYQHLLDRALELARANSSVRYLFREYDPNLFRAIAESDLIVSRCGSGTVAELGFFAKPAILIPLPNAPGDHQKKNAEFLESKGAAVMILDEELSDEVLATTVGSLISDVAELAAMKARAASAFRGDGGLTIAHYVRSVIEREEHR